MSNNTLKSTKVIYSGNHSKFGLIKEVFKKDYKSEDQINNHNHVFRNGERLNMKIKYIHV